ncbi:hypothetical protein EW026_g1197 [Hermanssonia centrifuga]|uniref:Uncharacterized protein n=1 Tax=Hermanssonia centrifuga TaxID=98765 RepID=A0A4V3XBC4_9APHY|nr:hypothetical protein EW026_g1197 [Hermanssonia centrifuga]
MTDAAQLKDKGNKLFLAKDYAAAYFKYSQAIEIDGTNAVFYANRAACSMALKKYVDIGYLYNARIHLAIILVRFMDAATDCKKASPLATELDPTYVKAWARIAQAYNSLAEYERSKESYKKALALLPVKGLTKENITLKEQCETGLNDVQRKIEHTKPTYTVILKQDTEKMPWHRAVGMDKERLARLGTVNECARSSVWLLLSANQAFNEGLRIIEQMKGIEAITNAIIQDERIFRIEDRDWIKKYNNQMLMELQQSRAWSDDDPEFVIAAAQKRQQQEGWDAVKPALAITVRGWIMRGVFECLKDCPTAAVEFYSRSLEVLKWGQRAWRNVPKEKRGVIFEDTFIRGVRVLHLNAYLKAYQKHPGLNSDYPLANVQQGALDAIKDIQSSHPPADIGPGELLSYYVYPEAHAFAMLGFYHDKMAKLNAAKGAEFVRENFQLSGEAYIQAGSIYPPDDENHAWFLNCGLDAMYNCGATVEYLLPVMQSIRTSIPEMKRIWEHSAASTGGRDSALERALFMEARIRKGLLTGELKMNSQIILSAMQEFFLE